MTETDTPRQQDTTPDKADKSRRRRRILIISGVAVCALVLGVLFLPKPVARYVIADQLDQMGIVHKGVDTLEIDLWNQEVKVGPLAFRGSNATAAQVGQFALKLRFANLFNRRAVIDHIIIDGVDLNVRRARDGTLSINGLALQDFIAKQPDGTAPAPEEDPWQAALEKLQLRNSRVVLDQEGAGKLTMQVGRLDLEGFRTWEPEKPGKFDLDATLNGVSFKWHGEARPFADKITLSIDATVNDVEIAKIETFTGSLGLERNGGALSSRFNHEIFLHSDGRIDWATKGTMEVSSADIALAGQGDLGIDAAKLFVTANFSVRPDNGIELKSTASAVTRKIRTATSDGQSMAIDELILELPELAGKILPDGKMQATLVPRLAVKGAKLAGSVSAQIRDLKLDMSKVELKKAATALSLSAAGSASLEGAAVAMKPIGGQPAADITIASLRAPLDGLSFSLTDNEPRWQAALSVAVKNLTTQLAKGEAADIRLTTLSVDQLRIDQSLAIAMKALLLGGLNAKLSDKILPAPQTEQSKIAVMETGKPVTVSSASDSGQVGITIGRLALVDRGAIRFVDGSVTPTVDSKVAVETFEITNLDTANPHQKSDVKIKAKINEFTDLDLSGWATPFLPKPDFDLKLALKGLELPRFSPYVARAVGMNLDSGQLNLAAAATGKQAAIDGKLDVNLRNLELGDLSPEDAKKLAGAVGMPIQTAIGLLQDSDKVINLNLPVRGTVAAPDLDLSDAIQKAVGSALTSLFPPTAIASMLISATKGGATFAPVPFKVGTASLDNAGKTMAKNLAQLLTKRPKLALRVCGRATLGDVEHYKTLILAQQQAGKPGQKLTPSQLRAAKKPTAGKGAAGSAGATLTIAEILKSAKDPMAKLALDRTRSLRNLLLAQDKNLKGRVSECRSAYNPKDTKPPRADVTL